MGTMAVGAYQTACEASLNKQQIDMWLNDRKSAEYISQELKSKFGESISPVSIRKYKKYRDDWLKKELEKDPLYQAKSQEIQEHINDGVGKIKTLDVIGTLSNVIEDSAAYLSEAREEGIVKIRNMQDYKFVAGAMLDAIKIYGDTMLKAQRMDAIDKDPTLLKATTINVNVKSTLKDILGEVMQDGGYELIDKLRAGMTQPEPVESTDIIEGSGEVNE
jgi:hypothetical protein